jgi:hypothetical protein
MARTLRTVWVTALLALAGGCASGPLLDNPLAFGPSLPGPVEQNPVFVPPHSYALVYEKVFSILSDFGFEIYESNRLDGHIETLPRIAPGVGELLKPGSPDAYERLLATLQTYRHRILVTIQLADNGGFFVQVTAFKELEDLPRPVRATAGAAIFRSENDVERQYEVIDPTFFEAGWIPKGRDLYLEQAILQQIKNCM